MPPPAPLLFLTGMRASRFRPVYAAVEVFRWDDTPDEDATWSAWVLADDPIAVTVAHPDIHFVQATTNRGWVWFEDGRQMPRPTAAEILNDVASARRWIRFTSPVVGFGLPVFVASVPRWRPFRRAVVARLAPIHFQDLADVRVELEWRLGSATEERDAARALTLPPGLCLPVELDVTPPCGAVLRLDARREDGHFDCTLFLPHASAVPAAGHVLRRRTRRDLPHRAFRAEADVATLLHVGPPLPIERMAPPDSRLLEPPPRIPVVCLACGTRFEPTDFSVEQLEVADAWAYRTSFHRELIKGYNNAGRRQFLRDKVAHYDNRIAGRRVNCPRCRTGAVSLKPGWWEPM